MDFHAGTAKGGNLPFTTRLTRSGSARAVGCVPTGEIPPIASTLDSIRRSASLKAGEGCTGNTASELPILASYTNLQPASLPIFRVRSGSEGADPTPTIAQSSCPDPVVCRRHPTAGPKDDAPRHGLQTRGENALLRRKAEATPRKPDNVANWRARDEGLYYRSGR